MRIKSVKGEQEVELQEGDRYGLLTIIEVFNEANRTRYRCRCECGNEVIIPAAYKLYRGNSQSCGCLVGKKCAERNKNNALYSQQVRDTPRLQDIRRQMIRRCEDPSHISYPSYGGRGISVCTEWHDPEQFTAWALAHGYADDLTIDRINNDLGYTPDNCRWATRKEQNNNSSHCHYITYKDKTQSIMAWSEQTGIPYGALKSRLTKLHWSVDRALEMPVKK